jgi:hypothetical protein
MPCRPFFVPTVLAAVFLVTCAQDGGRSGSPFPTPQQLDQLRQAPAPENPFKGETLDVDSWALEEPLADRLGTTPHPPASAWDVLLDEAVTRRQGLVLATEEMHCVAREFGRFFITHRRHPTPALRRFVSARCGVPSIAVGFGHVGGRAPETLSEDRLLEQWRDTLLTTVEAQLVGGPRFVGIWFGRQEDYAVVMITSARRDLWVDPVSTILGEDRRLILRGEALVPAGQMRVLINRGRHRVVECAPNPEAALPRFEFECEAAPRDSTTWVSVSLTPPGRLLGRSVLELFLRAPGERADVYRRPLQIASVPVTDLDRLPDEMTALVNRVRREAEFAPLQVVPEQSRVAFELAPHFFSALFGQTNEQAVDLVLLGMMAGWQVDGIVQRSHVGAAWVSRSNDAGRLLAEALDHPVSRETLMDPNCEKIAIGALAQEPTSDVPALAALIATYAVFSEESHGKLQAEIFERFTRVRAERGLGPPDRLSELEGPVMDAANRVETGENPQRALSWLLEESVDVLQRPVNGWFFEGADLEQLEFPEDFLTRRHLGLAIGVSHYQPEGEPWGRYVVMLVAAEPERRTAAEQRKDGLALL